MSARSQQQAEQVAEQVMEGWSYDMVELTAERGVADADRAEIAEIIEEQGLYCEVDEACAALVERCRQGVEA